ncbi:Sugar or nucleoside kinase, ribokinase family [Actinacidiphila alni]|uniref:Sugar or nucleoside kinase, ribokinase family n=1 Tax=Actinacidiphila alni TaxID=380248 RepID=A0A1I2J9E8_9ACTN|nr:Sugar or nucleoside kinase, ribokinase family [Actinacidiphila alni]
MTGDPTVRGGRRPPRGLFVGLTTLDIIQLVDHVPAANEKVTARAQTVAAGGPAANAAAAFSHLGGEATLLTAVGGHPLAAGVTADLAQLGVRVVDLAADSDAPPAVSSILVTAATGERAVASLNTTGRPVAVPPGPYVAELVAGADVVECDGHHIGPAIAVARAARTAGRRTVLDGGSWKPGTEELLPFIDVAVCSADFRPPEASTPAQVLDFLASSGAGVPWAAVTHGGDPVVWAGPGGARGELPVAPAARIADTLGAGDVLHGALAYVLAAPPADPLTADQLTADRRTADQLTADRLTADRLTGGRLTAGAFRTALAYASAVATASCASFGTRAWMREGSPVPHPATPTLGE